MFEIKWEPSVMLYLKHILCDTFIVVLSYLYIIFYYLQMYDAQLIQSTVRETLTIDAYLTSINFGDKKIIETKAFAIAIRTYKV